VTAAQLSKIALTAAVGVALVISATSCAAILSPCSALNSTAEDDRNKFMDGTWVLTNVDGNPVNTGYRLLDGSVLNKGEMDFQTLRLEKGSCEDPKSSSGEIIALYALTNRQGVAQKSKVQAGSFKYTNDSRVVVLAALGRSASGTANLAKNTVVPGDLSSLQIAAKIPLAVEGFDLGGSITYNLLFRRRSN